MRMYIFYREPRKHSSGPFSNREPWTQNKMYLYCLNVYFLPNVQSLFIFRIEILFPDLVRAVRLYSQSKPQTMKYFILQIEA